MRLFAATLRLIGYLYHLLLSLFLLGVGIVATASAAQLSLGMLPWTGDELTHWVLALGATGIVSVVLAATGFFRYLLPIWAIAVFVQMVRGFFLSSYAFSGPDQFHTAIWLTVGALVALIGAFLFPKKKVRP